MTTYARTARRFRYWTSAMCDTIASSLALLAASSADADCGGADCANEPAAPISQISAAAAMSLLSLAWADVTEHPESTYYFWVRSKYEAKGGLHLTAYSRIYIQVGTYIPTGRTPRELLHTHVAWEMQHLMRGFTASGSRPFWYYSPV